MTAWGRLSQCLPVASRGGTAITILGNVPSSTLRAECPSKCLASIFQVVAFQVDPGIELPQVAETQLPLPLQPGASVVLCVFHKTSTCEWEAEFCPVWDATVVLDVRVKTVQGGGRDVIVEGNLLAGVVAFVGLDSVVRHAEDGNFLRNRVERRRNFCRFLFSVSLVHQLQVLLEPVVIDRVRCALQLTNTRWLVVNCWLPK